MPDLNEIPEGEHLNEFELTAEEQAELDALDAQNGESDEVTDIDEQNQIFDDIDIDEEALLNGDPTEKTKIIDENLDQPIIPQQELEQPLEELPTDYSEQLDELDQQKQEAEGKIQDTLDQLKELATKYDDGEIGQGQYDYDRLTLQRQLSKSEADSVRIQAQHDALSTTAQSEGAAYQQKQEQTWLNDLRTFAALPENALIQSNPNVAQKFDQILEGLQGAGLLDGMNHSQVLSTVRSNLAIHFPQLNNAVPSGQNNKGNKPNKPNHANPNIPLTLANQQTLEIPDHSDPFAYLHKLNGIEYEKAIAKLSEDQLAQLYQ